MATVTINSAGKWTSWKQTTVKRNNHSTQERLSECELIPNFTLKALCSHHFLSKYYSHIRNKRDSPSLPTNTKAQWHHTFGFLKNVTRKPMWNGSNVKLTHEPPRDSFSWKHSKEHPGSLSTDLFMPTKQIRIFHWLKCLQNLATALHSSPLFTMVLYLIFYPSSAFHSKIQNSFNALINLKSHVISESLSFETN